MLRVKLYIDEELVSEMRTFDALDDRFFYWNHVPFAVSKLSIDQQNAFKEYGAGIEKLNDPFDDNKTDKVMTLRSQLVNKLVTAQ